MSENKKQVDFDYEVGGKIIIVKDGILHKAESPKQKNHGQSNKFIRMEQSGLIVEPNWKG